MKQTLHPFRCMIRPCFVLVCIVLTNTTFGQNKTILIESSKTCYKDKLMAILDVRKQLKPIKDDLVKEGKLIHASDAWWEEDKSMTYETYFIAESQAKYDAAIKEFNGKVQEKCPQAFKVIAEACYKSKDTIRENRKLLPVIKYSLASAANKVDNIDELPDPKTEYNLLVDFTAYPEVQNKKFKVDSLQLNWGLSDIGRIYNLHAAAGVPQDKIKFVLAVHGYAVFSLLNNEAYQKKFKTDNPNLELIQELSNAGVRFLVCGQAMQWMKVKKESLIPQAKVTLTAKTTLTSYQLKGYALLEEGND